MVLACQEASEDISALKIPCGVQAARDAGVPRPAREKAPRRNEPMLPASRPSQYWRWSEPELTPDTLQVTLMAILRFRHKGLERFFERGLTAGVQHRHVKRLRLILGRLNVALEPRDMNLPGSRLHPLHGDRRGTWAVEVSGNWRVTFRFQGSDVTDVNYEDYH